MAEARRRRIEAYLGRLYGYAFSLSNDREQARDLVQDCALKALAARRIPVDEAAYRAWLFRIVRNAFLDRCRRKTEVALGGAEDLDDTPLNGALWNHDDRLIDRLTVRLGMAKLSRAHREVIAVVDIGGFSYAEAADLLDIPVGTVMSRLSRARQALFDEISESNVLPLPRRSAVE